MHAIRSTTALIAAATLFTVASSSAAPLVAPAGFEATDASGISDGLFDTGAGAQRYQQIYDASLFSDFFAGVSGPQSITEIQFRAANPENTFRPNSVTASNVMISLSTTSVLSDPGATADGNFSASFDDNVGADAQVVYSGSLTLDRGASNASGPQPFEYGFTLQTPFVYDPSLGNLLLDVIVPDSANVTQGAGFGAFEDFDASTASGDGVASARGSGGGPIGAAGQTGLITQFNIVPEPAAAALLALGGLALLRRRD